MDKLFKSKIHLKIIKFFHENQASLDTPRGIATWVGEDRPTVASALEDLVKAKILVAHRAALAAAGQSELSHEYSPRASGRCRDRGAGG